MNISLNKENELKFKLNIEGSKEKPDVRFFLRFSDNFSIMIKGILEEGSIAKVIIPKLPFLKEVSIPSIDSKLEVIVDGQYFSPWSGFLTIKEDLKVEAAELDNSRLINESTKKTDVIVEEIIEEDSFEEYESEEIEEEEPEEEFEEKVKSTKKVKEISLDYFIKNNIPAKDLLEDK